MTDKKLTALMPHRHHGSFFVEDCPHCAAGKRIAALQARLDVVMPLLENWMLYYTDGIPDDNLRDLYCASVDALGGDDA